MRIRFAAVAAVATLTCLVAVPALAQYPSKPVRMIVPLQPGGLADGFARLLGQHFSDRMGQPVIVENRPGGNQVIAAEVIAKSAPDGYTTGLVTENGMAL